MTGARIRALLLVSIVTIAGVALGFAGFPLDQREIPARPLGRRPALTLLTSLPLVFGDDFSLKASGSPALTRLQSRYRVVPISVTDAQELVKARLLLMAQPRAQTAENLVALDRWVRGGGQLLLLADPLLEWPSSRPLGDVTRPLPMFMDSGLLMHWGLRLDGPEERGTAWRTMGGYRVLTVSPGSLSGACKISADRLIAHCRLGAGTAIIVADADLLNVGQLGAGARNNLDGLLSELATLERS